MSPAREIIDMPYAQKVVVTVQKELNDTLAGNQRLVGEASKLRQLLREVSRSKYLDGVDWPELDQFRDQPPQPPT
jgi:hypothetical protein